MLEALLEADAALDVDHVDLAVAGGDVGLAMSLVLQDLLAATPIERAGEAEEIASCILFLLGRESSYVHGSLLFVDGGYDAHARHDHI